MSSGKYLFLVRHAKSSWKFADLQDYERPLNNRGRRDCMTMPDYLMKNYESILPQYIISSTAVRAYETALAFSDKLNVDVQKANELYHATPEQMMTVLTAVPDFLCQRMMLVGHNPGLTFLVNQFLKGSGDFIENLRTCSFVALFFQVKKWSQLGGSRVHIVAHEYPKKISKIL